MSCCKVKIEENKETKKENKIGKFFGDFVSMIISIVVLIVLLPVLFFFGVYIIMRSYFFGYEHSLIDMITLIKKGVMGAFRYDDSIDEEDLADYDDLINNPDEYEILNLSKETKNE